MGWFSGILFVIGITLYLLVRWSEGRGKGIAAEWVLNHLVLARLDAKRYLRLNNIYLPLPDGTTTQIDHIVISPYGVFVIETKNYQGWIFGDEHSPQWTQTHYRAKYRFQNPIRQNYKHLCALEQCTGIPKAVMRPVIAFSGFSTFKTQLPAMVVKFGNALEYIRSFQTVCIKPEQLEAIRTTILEWQASLSKTQIRNHVANLKQKAQGISRDAPPPRCPFCGGEMVIRHARRDQKAFYGCKSYPACKGIVKITDSAQ